MYGLRSDVFCEEAASALVKNLMGVGRVELNSAFGRQSGFELAMAVQVLFQAFRH
jgi:hypothetical protein